MTITSKFDIGQTLWFMNENKAVSGTVCRIELGNMAGEDNGDHESLNSYREVYDVDFGGRWKRHVDHSDIGKTVFTTREQLIATI